MGGHGSQTGAEIPATMSASDAIRIDWTRWAAALLLAGAALLLLARLGAIDFWAPDEPRYGQIAEELRSLEHGPSGLLLLHLNGEPYDQKPPLYFWLAALAGAPGGRVSELAARLPSALAGLATLWIVMQLGTGMLGRCSGLLGAALLLTVFEFARSARRAQLDILLTLCVVLALAAFWRIDRRAGRRGDLALLHGALGLGVLTKGPVALLVPLLAMAAYLAWERRLAELGRLLKPWALVLSLGPGIAWLAAASWLAPAGFLDTAVIDNLLGRFFAGSSHARPAYYYLYQFPVNFLPWTLLWPLVAWFAVTRVFREGADAERARAWRFLLAWVGAALLFFSLSTGKRGLYLLPVFPAAALLCADALLGLRSARSLQRFPTRIAALLALVFALELGAFTWLFPRLDAEKSPRPVAAAAARLTSPDEPIALTRRSLIGGIAYYGRRRTRVVETPADVERFLAMGGRVIVVPALHLHVVTRVTPVLVHARLRSGRRTLLVVTPATQPPV